MTTQIRNSDLPNLIQSDSFKFGLWSEVLAGFQAIPFLTAFYPMSSIQRSTGNVYDLSGQGRTLTNNGTTSFGYSGLVPYASFNGSTQYLSRADETDLDILGNESHVGTSPGLTLGGWFRTTTIAAGTSGLIGKANNSTQNSYLIYRSAATISFTVSSSGGSFVATSVYSSLVADTWYFVVGRFTPSVRNDLYVSGSSATPGTTSIPATLFNSTTAFEIGRYGTNYLSGNASLCFISHCVLSTAFLDGLYNRSRNLFGI